MGAFYHGSGVARFHLSLWERSELSSGEGVVDCFEDGIGLGEDDVVPEADDLNAARVEEAGADFVTGAALVAVVLAAVELDCKFGSVAVEVEDIGREWVLAAEFVAGESAVAEVTPKALFGIGGVLAEGAGEGECVGVEGWIFVLRFGHAKTLTRSIPRGLSRWERRKAPSPLDNSLLSRRERGINLGVRRWR